MNWLSISKKRYIKILPLQKQIYNLYKSVMIISLKKLIRIFYTTSFAFMNNIFKFCISALKSSIYIDYCNNV